MYHGKLIHVILIHAFYTTDYLCQGFFGGFWENFWVPGHLANPLKCITFDLVFLPWNFGGRISDDREGEFP